MESTKVHIAHRVEVCRPMTTGRSVQDLLRAIPDRGGVNRLKESIKGSKIVATVPAVRSGNRRVALAQYLSKNGEVFCTF